MPLRMIYFDVNSIQKLLIVAKNIHRAKIIMIFLYADKGFKRFQLQKFKQQDTQGYGCFRAEIDTIHATLIVNQCTGLS